MTSPLRIVHVVPWYRPVIGGSAQHCRALSEALAARGHDVIVVTLSISGNANKRWDATLPASEQLDGVTVRRYLSSRRLSGGLARLLRVPGVYRALAVLLTPDRVRMLVEGPWVPAAVRDIRRLRPDIVTVINWQDPALPLQLAALRRRARFALVGIPLFHTEEAWSRSPVLRRALGRADAMLVNTEHEARFVRECAPRLLRVETAGVGVDPALGAGGDGDARARYGLGDDPVVGYVGRVHPAKGVVTLIDAMPRVWTAVPRARLVLAGHRFDRGSGRDAEIDQALGRLTVEQRARVLHIEGFREAEKAGIYRAMDVFAMPSVAESFGISYLEAWLCARPVIGGRIGATACVIEEGVDGLLADPQEPADVARAVLALLADPERRRRMGEAGRAKTLRRYTWERVTDVVERVYVDLVRPHAPRPPVDS